MACILSKDTRKIIRQILQMACLLAISLCIWWMHVEKGEPPDFHRDLWTQRDGFLAISYNALTDADSDKYNSRNQFKAHMRKLKEEGYSYICSQDIIDFYNGKPLPEKALYVMMEGGRKDTVIYGQEILGENRAHASLYTHIDTLGEMGSFFIDRNELAAIERSLFWDVGSLGYRQQYLEKSPGSNATFFLCDYIRDAEGNRAETEEEMVARLETFYNNSQLALSNLDETAAFRSFIFVPANAFYRMPPEIKEANRQLIARHFQLAFTREGTAFNAEGGDVFNLTRMKVPPYMTPDELLAAMQSWKKERKLFKMTGPESVNDWVHDQCELRVDGDSLVLRPLDDSTMPAFLRGTDTWSDLLLSARLDQDEGERVIYLRYVSPSSYLRLSIRHNRLVVHERLPERGLYLCFDEVLPGKAPWFVQASLKHNRLKLAVNGKPMPNGILSVSASLKSGKIGLGARGEPGYQASFGDLSALKLEPVWIDRRPTLSTTFDNDEITASIIALPDHPAAAHQTLKTLLQVNGRGELSIAALPRDDLDFSMERLAVEPLNREWIHKMWDGVLIEPGERTSWSQVNKTLDTIHEAGFMGVVRLSRTAAVSLVDSGESLHADRYILDFDLDSLPEALRTALLNRQNRNHFLLTNKQRPGNTGNAGLYTFLRSE